ncbi:MAG: photosynthetic reaction center cytochrome PufC [Burkholderiales bacterium]
MTRVLGIRSAALAMLIVALLLAGCERPPTNTVQRGYRGTGMEQVYNPRLLATQAPANAMPADTPMVPPGGPPASTVFKNVKVVGDLGVGEFTRLMVSMTAWVAPDQGCSYCHKAGEDFSSDALYTKVVARRMLEMTRHINTDWKTHVADTGVTCYTCHRGQNVPANLWFTPPVDTHAAGMVGSRAGQNAPAMSVAFASLPNDPFTPYLDGTSDIRVIGNSALPAGNRKSTKQTEYTYGLMMHMSQALGVNCTFCHNTRSFAEWDASTPQRATAWYGIRMTRDLNAAYLDPLAGVLPANRLGPTGDVPKANCTTCHQGAFKPMYGASLLKTHPELGGVRATLTPAVPGPEMSATGAVLYFAVGSSALTEETSKGIAQLAESLKANAGAKLSISGFHSASGDLAQNQELAKQRAFSVRDALKAAGIAEDRVVLQKPMSAEANLAGGDPKARRVDVALK